MTDTVRRLLLAGMLLVSVLAGAGATTVAAQDGGNATDGDELTDEGNATEGDEAPETDDGEDPDAVADDNGKTDDSEGASGQAASGARAGGRLDRLNATLPGPLASWVAGTLGVLVLVVVGLVAWRG